MTCTLCELPTPEPPVRDAEVNGTFCCRGCLEVSRSLSAPAESGGDEAQADTSAPDPADANSDSRTAFFSVQGMHCATCETFLERHGSGIDGVRETEASYPASALKVRYDPDRTDQDEIKAVLDTPGYDFFDVDEEPASGAAAGRLLVGVGLGMMAMLWYLLFLYPVYLDLPARLQLVDLDAPAGRYLVWNLWVFASVVLGYTGWPILRGAWISLRTRQPNMDLLVATAATMAYLYSTLAAVLGHPEVYFDVSIVVVLAVTVGGFYERRVTRRATDRLSDIATERVDEARILVDGESQGGDDRTEIVPLSALSGGDRVRVDPGEHVPVDGTVLAGRASVDASLVTGESRPVTVEPGDAVHGGSIVHDGLLTIEVGPGATSTLDRLLESLWDLRASRDGVQRVADRLASVFVPAVIVVAALVTGWHVATGSSPTGAVLTGLTVLIVSCPCAIGLATPLAVAAGIRDALDQRLVITDTAVFERARDIDIVALDKTGTLTTGEMTVAAVEPGPADPSTDSVLRIGAALESHAEHPVAGAIVDAYRDQCAGDGLDGGDDEQLPATDGVRQHPGQGIGGTVDGADALVGRLDLFEDRDWDLPGELRDSYDIAVDDGAVPVIVGWDGRARGVIRATDDPRPGWRSVLESLGDGRRVVVVTGDDPAAAERFEGHPAVEDVFAGVPPDAKPAVVGRLQSSGPTAMVGDGSNDAPALARADVGIALGGGTDMAVDAAAVVVDDDDLASVPAVFELTAGTRRRVRENLGWAFLYNGLAIPAAVFGVLNPVVAAVAMATSSLLVVINSSRPVRATE
jgi:Cu2+-exporting ATPase